MSRGPLRRAPFATSTTPSKKQFEKVPFVKKLLREAEHSRDQLPYTTEFADLKRQYERASGSRVGDHEFWELLWRVGKRGGLARAKRSKVLSPKLTREQQLEMLRLLPDGIGSRDQLPYTDEFDHIHRQFSRLTRTNFDKREFWRVVSRVAKRSRKPQPLFETAPLGGLPEELIHFLERQNPWWSGAPAKPAERFRRWGFNDAADRLDKQITPIVAIREPRQVGKTTIQEQLIEDLIKLQNVNPARVFRVQFDEIPTLGSYRLPILALVGWFEKNVLGEPMNALAARGEPVYLFLDEVQNLKGWAPELKSLVDHVRAKTLITGSSALRIAGGRDSLAGRTSTIELGPLRLGEIVGVRGLGDLPPFHVTAALDAWNEKDFWVELADYARRHARLLQKAFDAFCELGGYPRGHRTGATRSQLADIVIEQVVNRTLDRDLRAGPGGRTRNPNTLRETFRRVCRYAGQAVRPRFIANEASQVLGAGISEKAVRDAVSFLCDALLVHEIQPLEALTKRQSQPPKLCICDHFVREAWLQERIPISPRQLASANDAVATTAGHLMESNIGTYLRGITGLDLSWFPERKGEPEVDFVATIGLRRLPIEVKYRRKDPIADDLRGLRGFCSQAKYNAPFGLLITQQTAGLIEENIIALPAYALLAVR